MGVLEGGEKCSYEDVIDEKTETIKIMVQVLKKIFLLKGNMMPKTFHL